MKNFVDFENFFNLDCQHKAIDLASEIAKSIAQDESIQACGLSAEAVCSVANIAAHTSLKYAMLMLEAYHQWMHDQF